MEFNSGFKGLMFKLGQPKLSEVRCRLMDKYCILLS